MSQGFPRRVTMKSLKVELPFWVRVVLLAGVLCLVAGAGLIAYRLYQRPVTLTVAVGSLDGEARQVASLIAGRLATTESPFESGAIYRSPRAKTTPVRHESSGPSGAA